MAPVCCALAGEVKQACSLLTVLQTHCCDHGVCVVGGAPVGISPALCRLSPRAFQNSECRVCVRVRACVCVSGVKALGMEGRCWIPTQSRHNLNTDVTWVLAQKRPLAMQAVTQCCSKKQTPLLLNLVALAALFCLIFL